MKVILFQLVVLVFSETLATGQCPDSTWTHLGNKCYYVKLEEADLYENIALCNQLNASLVSITSDEENSNVTQLIENLETDGRIWLGLGQRSIGQFYWFDGSPFVFNKWIEEPNVTYKYFGVYFQGGHWFTDSALKINFQVCSLDLTLKDSPKKTSIPTEFRGKCPNGIWRRVGSKCIYLGTTKEMTYMENQALCKELNATMVSIHSEEENFHLDTLSRFKSFWIGLKQTFNSNRSYEWEDGSPVTYKNWRYNEPSYLGIKYWAVYMNTDFSDYKIAKWRDTQGYDLKYPGCQTSLLIQPEEVSTETTSFTPTQSSSTVRTLDAVSKNTELPSDMVTKTMTEQPSNISNNNETFTA